MHTKTPARIFRNQRWHRVWILRTHNWRSFIKFQDGHTTAWVPYNEVKRVIVVPTRRHRVHRS